MAKPPRVLVLEPGWEDLPGLHGALEHDGFDVRVEAHAAGAIRSAGIAPPAAILVALGQPGGGGSEALRRLRASRETAATPILVASAERDDVDRVVAFELGADDVIPAPFSRRELLLRVRSLLRRRPATSPEEPGIEVPGIRVLLEEHRVFVGGRELDLTVLEFDLLVALLRRRGGVVLRQDLLREVWSLPASSRSRTLDTHLKRLRDKLGPSGHKIVTVRGIGFRYEGAHPDGDRSAGMISPA
jgi:two-component system phosphate regulon response regulator PhoB